jgi:hypothetical protein
VAAEDPPEHLRPHRGLRHDRHRAPLLGLAARRLPHPRRLRRPDSPFVPGQRPPPPESRRSRRALLASRRLTDEQRLRLRARLDVVHHLLLALLLHPRPLPLRLPPPAHWPLDQPPALPPPLDASTYCPATAHSDCPA